jgi:6-pyruvoyl tetrahydropterin synthase/QueD family protein
MAFNTSTSSKKLYFRISIFLDSIMPIIRVTKRFHFEMAHTLYEYDGLCRNIHGHSYNLEVTISGEPRNEPGHPKDGMVLDFSELKNIVKSQIINRFDHALMVNQLVPESQIATTQSNHKPDNNCGVSAHFRKYCSIYCPNSSTTFACRC